LPQGNFNIIIFMKTNIPFLGIRIPFLGLLAALLMGSSSLFGQIHIFPAAPRICLGDTVLLTVVADDPGNIPTFFQWIPSDSLSNPNAQSTLAYPIDTITYFVETNAGGASVTVYVMAPPATSFTGLEDTYYCANTPPITLNGTPSGGVFFTDAPSGLSGNIVTPSLFPTGALYPISYAIMYGDTSMCTDTVSNDIFVGAVPNATFTGLSASYCSDEGPVTLVPAQEGGTFSISPPSGGLSGNTLDLSLLSTGINYTITYQITGGDPPCPASSTQDFIVNELPFVSFSGLPGGSLCSNLSPITLTGSPAGGTFFTNAPTGLTGNVLTPSLVPFNTSYTLSYAFTAANGCADTATQNIYVYEQPIVSFSGLAPSYCEGDGTLVTLTGSPAGGFFTTDIPGFPFSGDVLDIDLNLVSIGTTFTVTYTFSAGGDPPCTGSSSQSFIVNPLPTVSFSGLPPTICANTPPITLVGSPAGGTFSTGAPSGLVGNILTPTNVPTGNEYALTYTYTDANGCTNSTNQSFLVSALPMVSFSGLSANYCASSPAATLVGSPAGGTFSTTAPAGLTGNILDPSLVPTGIPYSVTYTYTDGIGCSNTDEQTFIVNAPPTVSFSGLFATYCSNSAPVTLVGSPSGGVFTTTAPSGLTGNVLDPSLVPTGISYSITYTVTSGCEGSSTQNFIVNPLPVVNAGTYPPVCSNAAPITLIGSPVGGIFSGTGVTGNTFNPAVGTQTITYTFTDVNGCANNNQTTITVNPLPIVSAGTYTPVCINAAPITLTGSPVGGTFSGTGVTGNTFNPAVGTQTITYTFTDVNGCANSNQSTITVNPLPIVSAGTYPPVCSNAAPITLTGSPTGGIFSGTGVTGNTFNPAVGTQTITYTFTDANGCANSSQTIITVNPLPIVSAGTYAPVCSNAAPITLIGNPAGGIFSGTGVTGNTFNPAVGTQTITYTFTDANGCANSNQSTITVNPLPIVSAGTYAPVCSNAAPITLTGSPAGGIFSGTGVTGNTFNPAVGTQTITYNFTDVNGCANSNQTTITVNPLPIVSAGTYAPVCSNAAPITLTGSPAGGIFSGTGVTGNTSIQPLAHKPLLILLLMLMVVPIVIKLLLQSIRYQ
jgi:hypothetical protein